MKIAISTSSFASFDRTPLDMLANANIHVVQNTLGRVLTETEAIDLFQNCIGVIAGTEPLTAKVMQAVPSLKVISRCGVGLNSVDMQAAKEHKISVHTTSSPVQAVAELVLGLAISLLRHIPKGHKDICAGHWKKRGGHLLQGKKLGIIGLGRIGTRVAEIFSTLGCEIAYYDPYLAEGKYPYTAMNLQDLLAWADMVSLHCPPSAKPLLGQKELRFMQKGAWLINTARGGLVHEDALYECLLDGHLAGAALDVFEVEPYVGPLTTLDNVILSPHCASYAKESRIQMEVEATYNLLNSLGIKCQFPA